MRAPEGAAAAFDAGLIARRERRGSAQGNTPGGDGQESGGGWKSTGSRQRIESTAITRSGNASGLTVLPRGTTLNAA